MLALLTALAPLRTWIIGAAIAAAIGAVVTGLWLMRHDAFEDGKAAATREIDDANRKAEDQANAASQRVVRCYGAGGTWDRARGVCQRATAAGE